jgi:UDP-N-acetylglucosamine 4,6-dehydratase
MAVVSKLLGREIVEYRYLSFEGKRVAVTGGMGALGRALIRSGLPPQGGIWTAIDLSHHYDAIGTDILNYEALVRTLHGHHADMVVHAAANKHAPEGELHPAEVARTNIDGTENVVNACLELGIDRLVFLSTCKAAQPETVYGASKLVGERIVLNAGFTVARLYNVVESSRNVFEIWQQALEEGRACEVASACRRRFIHLGEARSFILSCFDRDPGRYVPYAEAIGMDDLFMRWQRENADKNTGCAQVKPRRGDRIEEPRWASYETGRNFLDGSSRVTSPHD